MIKKKVYFLLFILLIYYYFNFIFHIFFKGYIDLSKRRVAPEDVAKCEDRFNKAKAVHSVLRHIADYQHSLDPSITLETLYTKIGWPLYRKYGHAYDAFKLALSYVFNLYFYLHLSPQTYLIFKFQK